MSKFVVYQDRSNQWRWRFLAANGKIIADSAEAYWNKADCKSAIGLLKRDAPGANETEE